MEVWLKPFQRLVGAAAIGGRSAQRAKYSTAFSFAKLFFCASGVKRKAGVEQRIALWRKVKPVFRIATVCPLFSLAEEAQRKKLGKKETRIKEFRLCGGDQRSARWIGASF